jgi:pyruvate/2-oxoglutarate dehydrogenase complex dihydrolipoamide dehydrogenase (E3) component
LGGGMVCTHAGDMIGEIALAIGKTIGMAAEVARHL